MKTACVEFYKSTVWNRDGIVVSGPIDSFAWRLRAKNGQIILSPHETFISHRNAVASFKRICKALDARGPWQIKDLSGVEGSHAMLVKGTEET